MKVGDEVKIGLIMKTKGLISNIEFKHHECLRKDKFM